MPPPPLRALPAALATGVLLGAAALPGPLGPLAFVGFLPLLRVLARGPSAGSAARAGFVAGSVCFGIGFGWVPRASSGGLAPYLLALPLLAAVFGSFALLVAALARLAPRLALAAAPGLWVTLEYARSQEWVLSVPWAHLGYGLADWPFLAQGASVAGLYGLSFWIVAGNVAWLLLPRLPLQARLLGVLILLAPLAPGLALRGSGDARERAEPVLRVAAVQPAIPEADRHQPARFHDHLRRLLALTDDALAEQPADLVAWPESAYERPADGSGDAFLGAIAHHLSTPIVTGVWRAPDSGERAWRNAALLAAGDGTTWVSEKVHPVPVYERAPDGMLLRALARAGLGSGRFARGEPPEPVRLPSRREGGEAASIGVLVCIDASYPELARGLRAAGARLLVVVANEAGTGAWSAALHARAARLRAIEGRVPVVRVANTGPTLWIDAYGRNVAQLSGGAAGAGAAALSLAGRAPAFVRFGDARVVAAAAAWALAAALLALAQWPGAAARLAARPLTPARRGVS